MSLHHTFARPAMYGLCVALALAPATPATAQQAESRILGKVTDSNGGVLPGSRLRSNRIRQALCARR